MHHDIRCPPMLLGRGLIDDNVRKVTPIAVSSYEGCAPSFIVKTEEGAIYVDVPPHLLLQTNEEDPNPYTADLTELVYKSAPSRHVWVGRLTSLEAVQIFDRTQAYLGTGTYLATMDWYQDNWMAHVVLVTSGVMTGRLMIWPHFRLLFNTEQRTLPKGYRKVRQSWRVP